MSTPEPSPLTAQRIQFGDEISPVKSTGATAYSDGHKEPSLVEKRADYDTEEMALQIADADLNSRKKQVRPCFV